MKNTQRLEYERLAEVLAERGLVDSHALREALHFSGRGSLPFSEALVTANLVTDWELSRVVCELYNLPFLTVEIAEPDLKASENLDAQFLSENCLVPLGRFNQVLTVCMPAMVSADVLGMLAAECDLHILPVVGTVRTNRKWLELHIKPQPLAPLPGETLISEEDAEAGWSSIFDAADAAVLLDLKAPSENDEEDL